MVEDGEKSPLRMRLAGGHFLLADDQDGVEEAAGDVVPALEHGENARAPADVAAHHRLAPGPTAVGEVLAFHVHAVKGVRRGADHHTVHVVQRQLARFQRQMCGLPGQFLGRLLSAADELGHPRADDSNAISTHRSPPSYSGSRPRRRWWARRASRRLGRPRRLRSGVAQPHRAVAALPPEREPARWHRADGPRRAHHRRG